MKESAWRRPDGPSEPVVHGLPLLATAHADADDSPGLLMWQVTNRWQAAQRAALRPFNLTHVQFVLLESLTWLRAEGVVTQKRLAQHAATDPMMTSQVLRGLETRGLIGRARHPTDARARALSVTDAGVTLVNRAVVAVEKCDTEFFAPLGRSTTRFTQELHALRQRSTG